VNIVAFHALLAGGGNGLPLTLLALEVALAYFYRDAFAPMLRARVEPATLSTPSAAPVPAH
jgi:hypothetical protein